MMKLGLLGSEISRSLSPRIFQQLGKVQPTEYSLCPAPQDADLATIFQTLKASGFRGLNITRPFKVQTLSYFQASDLALKTGAVNWVDLSSGTADNTDVRALVEMLRPHRPKSARIYGMGGAARAAAVALQEVGCARIFVTNRTRKGQSFPAVWDDATEVDWLIQASPERGESPVLGRLLELTKCGVLEMLYDPAETPLLLAAKAKGLSVLDGVEMLIRQALLGFELWTGQAAPDYAEFRTEFDKFAKNREVL